MLATRARMAAAGSGVAWYAGLTDLVAAYQPIGAASLAASYVNLANPGTNDAAPGVAPTWNATAGWIGDGTRWLDTGIILGNQYTALVRYSNYVDSGTNVALIGSYLASSPFTGLFLGKTTATNTNRYRNGDLVYVGAGTESVGVIGVAGATAYFDGISLTSTLGGNGGNSLPIYLLAARGGVGPANFITANIQAVAICSSAQTPGQMAAASAAMAAL